jgi:hypothetical protein
MNTLKMNPFFRISGALLTLSLASACYFPSDPELEVIPLQKERTADTLRFSWEGDMIHRFEVVQCETPPSLEHCGCNGTLVWGVGPGNNEQFRQVALEAPFIASPLEYGVTPPSDRKGYASRSLVAGETYIARAVRVGPCDNDSQDCQQMIALGCQSFVW